MRTLLILGAPLILLWTFVSTLVKWIGRAFGYAWMEALIEWQSFRAILRNPEFQVWTNFDDHRLEKRRRREPISAPEMRRNAVIADVAVSAFWVSILTAIVLFQQMVGPYL